MREKITNLFYKVEDFVLATAFALWIWLGKALDIRIEVPQPQPWVIYEEIKVIDAEIVAERDELKAKVAELEARAAASVKGEDRPNRKKLTQTEVQDIRSMKRMGITQAQLADIYDVNPATISRIVRNQYYPKLTAA